MRRATIPQILACLPLLGLALMTVLAVAVFATPAGAVSLREAYEAAAPGSGYDRVITLQTGQVYTGGLLIGPVLSPRGWGLEGEPGEDVKIIGNGAILDLRGEQICISYCDNRLDIEDCVILRGNVRFRGIDTFDHYEIPTGSVRYCTFYGPHDYGVRLQGTGSGVTLERNIIVDAVSTGPDFLYVNGWSNDWLPTGGNFAPTVQTGLYGYATIQDNWTYHTDHHANSDSLRHFVLLCEYG